MREHLPAVGKLIAVATLAGLVSTRETRADSPRTPRPSVVLSPNKTLRLDVTPLDWGAAPRARLARNTTLELTEAASGKRRFLVETDLGDPDAILADSGHVALFSWARDEQDKTAVVLLGPDGKEIRRLAPSEFMTPSELRAAGRSVSHLNWEVMDFVNGKSPHRFDAQRKHLVLGVQKGALIRSARGLESPGVIERRIDLATGKLVNGPDLTPKTAAELVARLEKAQGPARDELLGDLAQLHPMAPETLALWRRLLATPGGDAADRALALQQLSAKPDPQDFARFRTVLFDDRAPVQERTAALGGLAAALDAAELKQLSAWLGMPGHPLAAAVIPVLTQRGHKPALEPLLGYFKRLPASAYEREQALESALILSDWRADVVELALADSRSIPRLGFLLSQLGGKDPARAQPIALAALASADRSTLSSAHNILVASVHRKDPQREKNFDALLKAAADPGSPVAKSTVLIWNLASMLIDQQRFAEAEEMIPLQRKLEGERDENPEVAALAQLGFLAWVRGDDTTCLEMAKKLEAGPGKVTACRPEWRDKYGGNAHCQRDTPARIAEKLKERCGGSIRARCELVNRSTLEVTLTNNSSGRMVASSTTVELTWFQGGETIVLSSRHRTCAMRAGVDLAPGQSLKQQCKVEVPWEKTGSSWPLRADAEVTLWLSNSKKEQLDPSTRCTAFANP
ncbi:MAG: hypothetical protein ACOZIN_01505 [Myxococcota bacterium]